MPFDTVFVYDLHSERTPNDSPRVAPLSVNYRPLIFLLSDLCPIGNLRKPRWRVAQSCPQSPYSTSDSKVLRDVELSRFTLLSEEESRGGKVVHDHTNLTSSLFLAEPFRAVSLIFWRLQLSRNSAKLISQLEGFAQFAFWARKSEL